MSSVLTEAELARALRKALKFHPSQFRVSPFSNIGINVELLDVGGIGAACPFEGNVQTGASPGTKIFQFTSVGAMNSGLPLNMFDVITGKLLALDVSTGSDLQYIQLHCFTDGQVVTSCSLEISTTPAGQPAVNEETAPSEFFVDLYVLGAEQVPYRVIECHNLLASAVVALLTDKSDPICAGDPHTRHMTWEIKYEVSP